MSNEDIVLDTIEQIEKVKRTEKRQPVIVTLWEIKNALNTLSMDEIKEALNNLYKKNLITHGKTINDKYFQSIKK